MPFNRNDIYTTSGSTKLYNAWTPYVSKYDTSSFYNWEQDNLPLYDLEERTYELWEQGGFSTSASIPGLALVVSGDAPLATLAANRNIFTTVSACIAAIPKVVRFPVLIEVANFGNLGKLELKNFRIEENGSIEIINRNFARVLSTSSLVNQVGAGTTNTSHILCRGVSSLDVSSTLFDSSCLSISSRVFNGANDSRAYATVGNLVTYPINTTRKAPLSVHFSKNLFNPPSFVTNVFGNTAVVENGMTGSDETLTSLDISSTNTFTDSNLVRHSLAINDAVTGNIYLNRLTKITVENCDGPIYIRNFFVNNNNEEQDGIEVLNSKVVLENCASIRNKNSGFKFNNSKVTLSRSAYAYRNYDLDSTTTRVPGKGIGFNIINSEVIVSSLPLPRTSTSIGDVHASACDLSLVASRNSVGFSLENSKIVGGIERQFPAEPRSGSILASELNTDVGINLNNSIFAVNGLIDIYHNNVGIDCTNSNFIFESLCVDAQQAEGVKAQNSNITYESEDKYTTAGQSARNQLDMSANAQHIVLNNNSYFGFTIEDDTPSLYGGSKFSRSHGAITWDSTPKFALPAISVNDSSILELIHPNIQVNNTSENVANVPCYGRALKVMNNSKASLFGSETGCTFVLGPAGYTYQQKMAGLYAKNNSQINIHGPTVIAHFGVDALVEDKSILNIKPYCNNEDGILDVSSFDLSSPANHTSVELHSTRACLVANKDSIINMEELGSYPANWARTETGVEYLTLGNDYETNTFDISAFTTHGGLQFYPNPQDTTAIGQLKLDDLQVTNITSIPNFPTFTQQTGLLTFLVNDDPIGSTPNWTNRNKVTQGGVCLRATNNSQVNVRNVHFPIGNSTPMDGIYYTTSGDGCSKLMIWNIADTSKLTASYLSVSGSYPADTQYHGPKAYWTSSVNGTSISPVVASGAPMSTPDTGVLSILDLFGEGSGVWVMPSGVTVNSPFNYFYPLSGSPTAGGGVNSNTIRRLADAGINCTTLTAQIIGSDPGFTNNQGVFRIYFSPHPSARILQNDLSGFFKGAFPHGGNFSGVIGPAYQIFAQGYNCSAPLSALPPEGEVNASGVYPNLLKMVTDTNANGIPDALWTSGFYYCKEFLDDNPTQCILDESAAKSFANAQNASIGMAGRPKRVTIYYAKSSDSPDSESFVGDTSGALGFKSAGIFDLSRDN